MPPTQQRRRQRRIKRLVRTGLVAARGHEGWRAYEAAKQRVRAHALTAAEYDDAIDRMQERLEI